jgi:hypothetical protein
MAVIERDLDALVCHLRFPSQHRERIRSTNLLERTFVEVRRRTKVIGRFPGETSARSLVWAVLELSSRSWRGITKTASRRRDRAAATRTGRIARSTIDDERGGDRSLRSRPSGATSEGIHPHDGTPPSRTWPTLRQPSVQGLRVGRVLTPRMPGASSRSDHRWLQQVVPIVDGNVVGLQDSRGLAELVSRDL